MPTEQAKGQTAESLAAQAAKLHKEVSSLRARCDNIDQVLTESYKMLERIKQKKVASINIRLHQFMVHGHSLASHGNQLFPTRTGTRATGTLEA
ncbi:hypothetical protein ACJ41O_002030 [Fusarium nematophilum]